MKLSAFLRKNWIYTLVSFLIPFVGMLLVMLLSGSVPFGTQSLLYSDMYHQYYPFFVEYRRALLSGESLLYSWNVGLGMDYLGLISYYLASPLYLLSVFVPERWLLEFFSLLMPVKLGLAGMFFSIFLRKVFRTSDWAVPLFSSFYALCAWALGYQWNIMWLDTFALLPLVILGTISILKERKFILYTLTLFLSIFSNYYIGLFTCIFVLLVFICYEICCWKSFKKLYADLLLMAFFSALAVGMTAIIELPALAALQTTHSSINKFPEGFRLNIADENTWKGLLDAMRQVAGNMNGGLFPTFKEGLPNLYCGVGTVVLSFLFLTCKQVKLRDKICSIFLLLLFIASFIIRQLDYIWHGFHFTNMIPYRFSFLFSFVLLVMAYRAYLLRGEFRLWQILVSAVFAVGILLCGYENISLKYLAYNGAFLILYVALFCLFSRRRKIVSEADESTTYEPFHSRQMLSLALCGVLAMEIILNIVNFSVSFGGASVKNYPKGTDDTTAVIQEMRSRESDTVFYRAETTHSQTLNDGALNGYYGISAFTSSANAEVTQFMKQLGFGAMRSYNRYCYEESSPVANLFLGIKYMIERDGNTSENAYFDSVYSSGNVHLLENNAYLPLGFLANNQLINVDFSGDANPFIFQNQLFTAATDLDSDVWSFVPGPQLEISGCEGNSTAMPLSGYCSYDLTGQENETISYTYSITTDGLLCFYLNQTKRNSFSVWKNDVKLYSETYSIPQMLSVCNVSAGDKIEIRLSCKSDESGSINIQAATLNETLFRQGYDILSASVLEISDFSNTQITGTIECDRSGVLYTSIPQNGNWEVYVDGQQAEIVKIGNVMVGVLLPEGTHEITFRYQNKAFYIGSAICAFSLAVFLTVSILFCYKKRKYPRGKYER